MPDQGISIELLGRDYTREPVKKSIIDRVIRKLRLLSGLKIRFFPRTLEESLIINRDVRSMLILGLSRTGTSLLQRVLNADSRFFISYESIYMPFLEIGERVNIIGYYYELLKQYRHLCVALHGELDQSALKAFTFEAGLDYVGDKSIYQNTARYKSSLRKAIQKSRIDRVVFTLRDPRGRSASLLRWMRKRNEIYPRTAEAHAGTDEQASIRDQAHIWNCYAGFIKQISEESDSCIILKYEDFVAEPERWMGIIYRFLDIPYERIGERIGSIKTDSVDAWRENLDAHIVNDVSHICRSFMQEFGYL